MPTIRPRSLILTVYGAYVRRLGGWIAVADLITLMSDLEVDAQAVRSSVSRLKHKGLLIPQKRGTSMGYLLSDEAAALFDEGDTRVAGHVPQARLSDGWVLAVFSVPEVERRQRHVLRSRLAWLGFGRTASGVWIAPAHLLPDAEAMLRRLDLTGYVHLFHAEYLHFGEVRELVGQWWDLRALQQMYGEFARVYAPVLQAWRTAPREDSAAFRDSVLAVTEWRRLPHLDPGLPPELLPAGWTGTEACQVFRDLSEVLGGPAARHVDAVTGAARA